jgi:hypothetical protein
VRQPDQILNAAMPRLALASQEQIESVYRESHLVWGAGLDPAGYRELWDEISATAWMTRHAEFRVWVDDENRVLSSMKFYQPLIRVGGITSRDAVLGAIFTPVSKRRRGHAAAMLRDATRLCRSRGARICLLFSDIGTGYYAGLGFVPLPAEEHWCRISPDAAAWPANWEMHTLRDEDLPDVRKAHDASCRRRPLSVIRDPEHWEFLVARTESFFSRLKDSKIGSRFRVVKRDGSFAGYVISVEGRGDWNLREIGAVDGDPATLEAVFRVAAGHARAAGLRRFYGWLPPELASRLSDWKIRVQPRGRALPMVLPLDATIDESQLRDPRFAFIPYQDQF